MRLRVFHLSPFRSVFYKFEKLSLKNDNRSSGTLHSRYSGKT